MQTTIIVPCHNEARRLQAAEFQKFVAEHRHVRFLFVNDGSSDETPALLERIAKTDALRFTILHLAKNSGKAEAVRQGVLHASAAQTEYIGYWDADLATPLDEIPGFVDVLENRPEISLVLGSRVPLLGHEIRRRPLRKMLGRLFSRVTSMVLGLRVHDTQCGAKLFRNTPTLLAAFLQPFGSRWIFDVELLARLIRINRQALVSISWPTLTTHNSPSTERFLTVAARIGIYECPLDHWHDVAGSKLRRGDFFKAIGELSRIWWRYLRPWSKPFVAAPSELVPLQAAARRAA